MRNAVLLLTIIFSTAVQAQYVSKPKKLEKITSATIKRVFQTCIRIAAYDTVRKRAAYAAFSGVVVSADGYVLTAAHAIKPKKVYLVTFPDGRTAVATGLGRMAIKNSECDHDLAMIKIIDQGTWPFAQMGSSAQMRLHQPAISISYPGSFSSKLPNVRIGRVTNVDYKDGYFETTCKMEPGDSGGPVFDAAGCLLGIHSYINVNEERNFEIPVDLYKKYWTALLVADDYKTLPPNEQVITPGMTKNTITIPGIQDLLKVPVKMRTSAYRLESTVKGDLTSALGTLVDFKDSRNSSHRYIISKSSIVGDSVKLLNGDEWQLIKVIVRDEDNDLVLLRADQIDGTGIRLGSMQDSLKVDFADLGKFLVTGLDKGRQYVSALSSRYIYMPLLFPSGYFGANATFIDKKITITNILAGSPAAGSLKLKDQVIAINGKPITQPREYGAEVSKYASGDSISVDVIRENQPMQVKLKLTDFPMQKSHAADQFEGGKSRRSTGFSKVLVHDAAILPQQCGSPVFDSDGKFYGINIARHSRTSAIIMPLGIIENFIRKHLKAVFNICKETSGK